MCEFPESWSDRSLTDPETADAYSKRVRVFTVTLLLTIRWLHYMNCDSFRRLGCYYAKGSDIKLL